MSLALQIERSSQLRALGSQVYDLSSSIVVFGGSTSHSTSHGWAAAHGSAIFSASTSHPDLTTTSAAHAHSGASEAHGRTTIMAASHASTHAGLAHVSSTARCFVVDLTIMLKVVILVLRIVSSLFSVAATVSFLVLVVAVAVRRAAHVGSSLGALVEVLLGFAVVSGFTVLHVGSATASASSGRSIALVVVVPSVVSNLRVTLVVEVVFLLVQSLRLVVVVSVVAAWGLHVEIVAGSHGSVRTIRHGASATTTERSTQAASVAVRLDDLRSGFVVVRRFVVTVVISSSSSSASSGGRVSVIVLPFTSLLVMVSWLGVLALVLLSGLMLVVLVRRRVVVSVSVLAWRFSRRSHIEIVIVSLTRSAAASSSSATSASRGIFATLVGATFGSVFFVVRFSTSATSTSTASAASPSSLRGSFFVGIFSGFFFVVFFGWKWWSFFFGLGFLVAHLFFNFLKREHAVESSDSAWLLDELKPLHFGLVDVRDNHTVDFV